MSQTVIGIFDNANEAQEAVSQLVSNGFTRNNIDISSRTSAESQATLNDKDDDDDNIVGFFRSLFGGDDDSSSKYSRVARRATLVTVHAQSAQEAARAADLLDEYGAVDVDERASEYGYTDRAATSDTTTNKENVSIPIIEEALQIGKREVTTGGVRLRSRIIERPVEESLRLRSEHVHVERHAVNRPASEADLAGFKEGTIEVSEHAEVPIVNKEARIVEEISLSKDVEDREEIIRDTVRKTDVDVEQLKADDDSNRPANL